VNTGIAAGKNAVENNNLCVTDSCKYRYGDVRMIGGGGAIVGGVVVGSAILAEETESFQEWLMTGRDGVLIKSDDDSSNDNNSPNKVQEDSSPAVANGAPGLPPDNDGDNDKRQNENSQKYQKQKQQERFDELKDIYDKNNPTTDLKIDGQTIRQGANGNRYSTRIYESQNLTDKQIYNYAEELAGQPLTKVRDGIYTARLQDGTNITLRNVSSSNTGARWTIDIRNSPTLTNLYRGLGKRAEIKFR
jgi:hypothetical protein